MTHLDQSIVDQMRKAVKLPSDGFVDDRRAMRAARVAQDIREEASSREQALAAALADAVEGMEDMIDYVPDYFRQKWGHNGYLERGRAALGLYRIERSRA